MDAGLDYLHLSHSGARLRRDGSRLIKTGGPRLQAAAAKQAAHQSAWLNAPAVLGLTIGPEVTFVQEWIDGTIPLATPAAAALATGAAAAYVLGGQAAGEVGTAPMIERLLRTGANPDLVSLVAARLLQVGCIPTGRTHGDLTYCNLLVSGADVYAVDFSDVTVEAPILDAVKLRQDTFHGWAARLTPVDSAAAAKADACLHEAFSAALRGYTALWPAVSAWSLLCRVFAYGNESTRAWAEKEAWRCVQSF